MTPTPPFREHLGERAALAEWVGRGILRERERRGLTREQLARAAEVTAEVVELWETGLRLPIGSILEAVCEALHVYPADLLPTLEEVPAHGADQTHCELPR